MHPLIHPHSPYERTLVHPINTPSYTLSPTHLRPINTPSHALLTHLHTPYQHTLLHPMNTPPHTPYQHTSASDIRLADVEASMRRSQDECNRLTRTLQVGNSIISIIIIESLSSCSHSPPIYRSLFVLIRQLLSSH